MPTDVDLVIDRHRAAGRPFETAGVCSFVRSEGTGDVVVMLHGLPSSSFLYRKVIPELAAPGVRALSFDLPGLGLGDRPVDLDYTLAGLARFAAAAVDTLGLDRSTSSSTTPADRWGSNWRRETSHDPGIPPCVSAQ
jgi:haloalkane dehalogenase